MQMKPKMNPSDFVSSFCCFAQSAATIYDVVLCKVVVVVVVTVYVCLNVMYFYIGSYTSSEDV